MFLVCQIFKKAQTISDLINLQNKGFPRDWYHTICVSLVLDSVQSLPEVAAVIGIRVAVFSHHHSVGEFPSC